VTPAVLAIVLLSAAIHAVWSVAIKGSQDPLSFNLLQAIPLGILFVPVAVAADPTSLPARFFWILAASGLAHAVYLYGLSRAFEQGDLTLVYPIARSTPAFLPLVAVPLLGEHISLAGAAGIATVVAGMWAVQLGGTSGARLDANALRGGFLDPGLGFALVALAATVGYGLTDKALMSLLAAVDTPLGLPPAVFAFFAIWTGCLVVFVPLAVRRLDRATFVRTLRADWRRACMASAIGVLGYGLILHALADAEASYVVAVRQSSVLFVLVLGVVFLRERPSGVRIAGALATVAGVALIALWG
jgi:drug/metabolite transporter (DMT)-like permease